MRTHWLAVALCAALLAPAALAAEYFVSPRGDDDADGMSVETAFRTVAKGASGLQPGDTLTILPGEYFESMELNISGHPDAPITIRAQRPRSVLLRGDVDVSGFERVPGTHFTWVADFDGDVQGVGERNTGVLYDSVPSAVEVEDVRGACFYDGENKRLYVHTSDSRSPDAHALIVSVTPEFGMLFRSATDIVVEGIGFSGYMSRESAPRPGHRTRWGLYFVSPERVTIRNCVAFLNGGGIGLVRPADSVIEDCEAFGNSSPFNVSGGNIITWTPATDTVMRRNIAYNTARNGVRFYGGGTENCVMEANIAWNCDASAIQIKGGRNATSHMTHNVAFQDGLQSGNVAAENVRHNIFRYSPRYADDGSNINTGRIRRFDPDEHFASPRHQDFRLQSDSNLRGTGPDGTDPGPNQYRDEVFFVGPDGDDDAPGTSVKLAWHTLGHALAQLRPGHTLYVLPGKYEEAALRPARPGEPDNPIVIRGRGPGARVSNPRANRPTVLNLDGLAHLQVEDMAIVGGATAHNSRDVALVRCAFSVALVAGNAQGLAVRNSSAGRVALRESPGAEITGTLMGAASGNPAPLELDAATAETLWSDRNAFAAGRGPLVRLDGRDFADLESWAEATGHDALSTTVAAEQEGLAASLAGRGPLGTNVGPWRTERVRAPAQIENVRVHSVTATTANIEWWTPNGEATTTLEWGPTPELGNKVEDIFTGGIFHTVSLTGLQPGRQYYFRASATRPVWEFHIHEDLARIEEEKDRPTTEDETRAFRTLAQDAPPRTYHVALDGDDEADGLTRQTAWGTIRHAAAAAVAGDTVLIHEGEYEEFVPVRATGDQGRPLTIRAAPGAEVWMNGSAQKRPVAFEISFKHHVVLDGIRLRHFRGKLYNSPSNGGAVSVRGGSNVVLRRCFYDGRTETYMPFFVMSNATRDLLVENCVVINGWNGVSLRRSPGLTLRHNVFYNGLIRNAWMFNEADEPIRFHHNIVCDNIPGKLGNTPIGVWHLESLQSDYNCYFVRTSEEERPLVSYIRIGGERRGGSLKLAELREVAGQDRNSIVANPGIPVTPEMRREYENRGEYNRLEMHRNGMEIRPLDFKDFMADPEGPAGQAADGRPIGLDPAAFEDF